MRVAVIGAGMAGLSAAHELLRLGADPVVFEAAELAGGKVGSAREQGYVTENGPHFFAGPLDALVAAAGLEGEVVNPQRPMTRWVHLGGRALKAPSMPLLARAGVFRALLEPLFARPPRDDQTLRDFLVSRFGRKAGGLAAAVMAAGVYAGDPEKLSARDAFPKLAMPGSILRGAFRKRERRPLWALRAGVGSLPEALAQRLGGRVRLSTPVTSLQPSWTVNGEAFDAVLLAAPASVVARLARPFAPRFADALGELVAWPVTLVHLGFPADALPRGFGAIDATGTLHATGTLLPSSMLPGRAPQGKALATAVCSAKHAALPDAPLLDGVLGDLRKLWGVARDPDYVRIVRHAEAIPQYAPGHAARVQNARALLAAFPRVETAGAAWDGVSVPDVAGSGAAAAARLMASSAGAARPRA
ncbi:MAG TPA: protoporphyrinogen oxidase [Myxococcales bacterium]|nr:protoporphyrinogen oxidase [Myxococcales bacterium]